MRNFLTNHGLVLLRIQLRGDATVHEIAKDVDIKEQAAHVIVRELEKNGFLTKTKVGRRNRYRVKWYNVFKYPALPGVDIQQVGHVLAALAVTMTTVKSRVLLHLADHPKEFTPGVIARAVGISEGDARVALQELEQDGIVSRRKAGKREGYAVNGDFLPANGGPLSMKDQVLLALETKPRLPNPVETIMRNLDYLSPPDSPSEGET